MKLRIRNKELRILTELIRLRAILKLTVHLKILKAHGRS